MAALQLLDHQAVLVGLGHGAALHRMRGARVEGQAEHGHTLEAFFLEDPEELGADEHDAGEERFRGVAAPRGVYAAVERLEGLDGSEEEMLAPPLVLLGELRLQLLAEGLVLRGEGADGGVDFPDAILGQARGLEERVRLTAVSSGGGRSFSLVRVGLRRILGQAASADGSRAEYTVRRPRLRRSRDRSRTRVPPRREGSSAVVVAPAARSAGVELGGRRARPPQSARASLARRKTRASRRRIRG